MIQGDYKDKELNKQVSTRLSEQQFCFTGKLKNTNQTSLGLHVCLREDLLDPPLEEPPSVFPSDRPRMH